MNDITMTKHDAVCCLTRNYSQLIYPFSRLGDLERVRYKFDVDIKSCIII